MSELTNEKVIARLGAKFEADIIATDEPYKLVTFTVKKERILDILSYLKNDPEMDFMFLTDLTGVHYPQPNDELGVVYHLHNLPQNIRVRVKAFMPKANPEIASATSLWESANWMERETFDFFGIHFLGHPNLKRILNVDDLGYHPLRKEYALEDPTRDDKDDRFFGRDTNQNFLNSRYAKHN